ncbi:glycosyl transferase [Plantibacter sp. RU18]
MQAFRAPRSTSNPYIVMLDRTLASTPGMEHLHFDWRRSILGRYDAIHFHWPEAKLGGSTRLKAFGKQALFAALLVRLRLSRIAVVRTVHNIELPQDISRIERALIEALDRRTTLRIAINETTPLPPGAPSSTILHGHYRDWFEEYPKAAATPGRFGYVGLIRRYKGVEQLVAAYAEAATADPDLSLTVGGKPSSSELASTIVALATQTRGAELRLHFLSDAELVTIVSEAELIVLPYRFMHNSGGTLAALSLDRPVLIPRNDANAALAAEVGPGWVHTYSGELDADDLRRTIIAVHDDDRSARPDLSKRDWTDAGIRHRDAFARAVAIERRRPVHPDAGTTTHALED